MAHAPSPEAAPSRWEGWLGRSRRAAWRRIVVRRALAALLVAAACWIALERFAPPLADAPEVVVARATYPAGHALVDADVDVRRLPSGAVPVRAIRSPAEVVGRVLAAPVAEGEVLTALRLHAGGQLVGLPAGTLAVHVPVADPGSLAGIASGDRVDVVAVRDGAVVVERAVVLGVDPAGGSLLSGPATGRGLTLGVPAARAGPLVVAALTTAGGGVQVVLHPG